MIGPYDGNDGLGKSGWKRLDTEIQANATRAGAVDRILATTMGGAELHHKEHGGFNFDIDAAYNHERDCFSALANLARDNEANQDRMLESGLHTHVNAKLTPATALDEWLGGCDVLSVLASRRPSVVVPAACDDPKILGRSLVFNF